jgi:hypothetical protein
LLLSSDAQRLFNTGYLIITNEHKPKVSKGIKEEFEK